MDERIENLFGLDRQSFNGLLCGVNESSVHTSVVGNSLFVIWAVLYSLAEVRLLMRMVCD